jgi:AcrR family transcriptional regulator
MSKEELVKTEILNSGRRLFQQYGLVKTTMEDIAKASGKGKSSLYYYYSSKDQIFKAIVEEDMCKIFEQLKSAVDKAPTGEEKIRAFTSTKIKLLIQRATVYNIVRGEISEHPQLFKGLRRLFEKQEIDLVRDILAFGIETKEFKKIDEADLDTIAFIMVSAIRGIEMNLLEKNKLKNVGERLDVILAMICHGIKNDPSPAQKLSPN